MMDSEKNRPFFSVLVTAFNVAPYIDKCIKSILGQTYENFELIVVDDGSTDETSQCLSAYKDVRVNVITQTNHGVSHARNTAIMAAHGFYILQVDGDDWVDVDALERLYPLVSDFSPDVVVTDYYRDFLDGTCLYVKQEIAKTREQRFRGVLGLTYDTLPPTRLYRLELFYIYKIKYPEHIRSGEDLCVDLQVFFYAENVIKLDAAFYHYYNRPGSICSAPVKYAYDLLGSYVFSKNFLIETGLVDEYKAELQYFEFSKAFLSLITAKGSEPWHYAEFYQLRHNISGYFHNEKVIKEISFAPIGRKFLIYTYRTSYLAGRLSKLIGLAVSDLLRCVRLLLGK